MSSRIKYYSLVLTCCLFAWSAFAASPLRVITWDLAPRFPADTNTSARLQQAAATLKKLDPDVILLQHIADWQNCDELAKALRPTNYNLLVCSAFRDPKTGALSHEQVAILSKFKSYIYWSEAWKGQNKSNALPGGFAFAAIHADNKNVGVFSALLGASAVNDIHDPAQKLGREASARQLLKQVDAVRNWTANRIESLVVAGDFNTTLDDPLLNDEKTLRLMANAGIANVFADLPLDQRITASGSTRHADATLDYLFVRNAAPIGKPQVLKLAETEHGPVAAVLDLTAPTPEIITTPVTAPISSTPAPTTATVATAPAPVTPVLTSPQPTQAGHAPLPPVQAQIPVPEKPSFNIWWLIGSAVGGMVLMLFVWLLTRRSRKKPAVGSLSVIRADAGATVALPRESERIVITHQSVDVSGRQPFVHIETPGSAHTQSQMWQRRAEEAERRARQANMTLRAGLLPHLNRWLREKLVRKLISDRSRLLETQRTAAMKLLTVDDRLSKIENQLRQRDRDYEQRIDELMKELSVAREENRELIRARIDLVKAEMARERSKAVQPDI